VRCFIEPNLPDNNVPFDNTTLIYLINLLWKLGLGLGLDLSCTILAFFTENNENEHLKKRRKVTKDVSNIDFLVFGTALNISDANLVTRRGVLDSVDIE